MDVTSDSDDDRYDEAPLGYDNQHDQLNLMDVTNNRPTLTGQDFDHIIIQRMKKAIKLLRNYNVHKSSRMHWIKHFHIYFLKYFASK